MQKVPLGLALGLLNARHAEQSASHEIEPTQDRALLSALG
jgi:hypothetical protein